MAENTIHSADDLIGLLEADAVCLPGVRLGDVNLVTGVLRILMSDGRRFEPPRSKSPTMIDTVSGSASSSRPSTRHGWCPLAGSMVNRKALTAAMIDSRDFLAARRRAKTDVMLPAGPKIAFTGGSDLTDHRLIWDTLDKVATKHPRMVLMHGGSPKGAELIASRWADVRNVAQSRPSPLDQARQGRIQMQGCDA